MSQYVRDLWGSDRGYPGGPVHAIVQTADGYLWIAAEKGLVRFDGLSFRLFQYSGPASNIGPTVLGLAAIPDGRLWARLRGPALVQYNGGDLENVMSSLQLPDAVVTAMFRASNDAIVFATLGHGTMTYRDGKVSTLLTEDQMPGSFVISMAEASDGALWIGTRDAGLFRLQGRSTVQIADRVPDQKINCLLAGADGEMWIGTDNGIVRWDGSAITSAGVPSALNQVRALTMIRDRDANIWVGTASHGLLRLNARGVASIAPGDPRSRDTIAAIFEDREGNLWVGSTRGIERIRDGVFSTFTVAEGLPSNALGPVYVDPAGRTWVAPSGGGLYWLRQGQVGRVAEAGLPNDVVYSIAGGAGDVWLGRQRGGLTRLRPRGERFDVDNFTQARGLAQNNVYAVHRANDGTVWAGTLSGGVSRYKDGRFTTYTVADGLASNTVSAILDTGGTTWFGTPNGLSALSRGRWKKFTTKDGLPSNEVNALCQDSSGRIWVGTSAGITGVNRDRVKPASGLPSSLRTPILGIAEDQTGSLWIATADRVLRVKVEPLAHGTLTTADLREYSALDGLVGLEGVKRHRSVAADERGRVWISTTSGLSMVDPRRVPGIAQPALIHIETAVADGRILDLPGPARLEAGPQRVTLTYAGLSLSVPERISYRYRLDGFDRDWSPPRREREAIYTNLAPGDYRFRVTSSNSEGLWNGSEAALAFTIAPLFWQTASFQLAAGLACAGLGWAAYRVRVRQVARRLNERFEERLAERTRIAQDLHDTLLQGFVSASMQLHVAADQLPADAPSKPSIMKVLDLMARVIAEGRNAVRGLRSSTVGSDDLEHAFSAIQQEVAPGNTGYRVFVQGRSRPLRPIIRDEVYRIGREALVNAFRHADAKRVELELEYAQGRLRLLVRDDGRGIDPQVLRSGSDGHWGLSGMRERADRIGGRFKVWSRPAAGTEVELSIPGRIAYQQMQSDRARLAATLLRHWRTRDDQDTGPGRKP